MKKHGKDKVETSIKMVKNKASDQKQYDRYSLRLADSPYLPKDIEKFKEIKYNKDTSIYKQLNREYKTISNINKTSENISRDINTYYKFRSEDIETTDHFIYDYHKRMYKKNNEPNYDFNKIVEVAKKPPNYYDEEKNRNVRVYDKIILISEENTNEMVSMRKGSVKKTWKKI